MLIDDMNCDEKQDQLRENLQTSGDQTNDLKPSKAFFCASFTFLVSISSLMSSRL